jgi:hypothetical protein
MIQSFELWTFSNKKYCLQKFIQKNFHLSTIIQRSLQKFIKSLPNWIQIPVTIHFSFSLLPSWYFCDKNGQWARKLSSLSSTCQSSLMLHPLPSPSLLYTKFALVKLVKQKEVMCRSPGFMLFYNQVLLLTCQGHTFTWSTTATHIHPAVHTYEESPDNFFFINTLFPLFILFTLDKQSKFALKLQKVQQPCPTLRKMIFLQIDHDFHQEIAYVVHNSLYNMIGYIS